MTVTRARLEELAIMRQKQKPVPELTPNSPYGAEMKKQLYQQNDREFREGITTLREKSQQMNQALEAVRKAGVTRAQFNKHQKNTMQP